MSDIASGSRVRATYLAETTQQGAKETTINTGDTTVLRNTTRNVNPNRDLIRSNEVWADRQLRHARHGFQSVAGEIGFELSHRSYEDFLAWLVGGSWETVTISSTGDITITTTQIQRASGSFVTDGIRPGDHVILAGASNSSNNGLHLVTAVTATALTVAETLTAEAASGVPTVTYPGARLDVGTNLNTFSLERAFLDRNLFEVFLGCHVNTMNLNVEPGGSPVSGSFGIAGFRTEGPMGTSSWDSSPTAAPTSQPMVAFDGFVYQGSAPLAVATAINLQIENNRTLPRVIGQSYAPCVVDGRCNINGTLSAYLNSIALRNLFEAESGTSIYFRIDDPQVSNQFIGFAMHDAFPTGAPINPEDDQPVTIDLPFVSRYSAAYGTSISIQRSSNPS